MPSNSDSDSGSDGGGLDMFGGEDEGEVAPPRAFGGSNNRTHEADGTQPTDVLTYKTQEYWEERFETEESKDWLVDFEAVRPLLARRLLPSMRILLVGVGNSPFGAALHDWGCRNLVNLDFSAGVIERMRAQHAEQRPGMEWVCADMTRMACFEDASFDVVLDKAAMDALLVDEGDAWHPSDTAAASAGAYVAEVLRVLRPGGQFQLITFSQPHFRRRYLDGEQPTGRAVGAGAWAWDVSPTETIEEGLGYFFFEATKHGAAPEGASVGEAAVVVLGQSLNADGRAPLALARRVARGAEEYARATVAGGSGGCVVVLTGGDARGAGVTEASVMAKLLADAGNVAAADVVLEERALSTVQNALNVAALLRTRSDAAPVDRCLLVTSGFHMPRAESIFEAALASGGCGAIQLERAPAEEEEGGAAGGAADVEAGGAGGEAEINAFPLASRLQHEIDIVEKKHQRAMAAGGLVLSDESNAAVLAELRQLLAAAGGADGAPAVAFDARVRAA